MAAEVAIEQYELEVYQEQSYALVEAVPEMPEDRFTRQRAARFIGACLTENEVELTYVESVQTVRPIESLYEAIHLAAEQQDPEARKLIETNVKTDIIERTIKSGHVSKVDLHVDEAGRIQQFGQSMESVQANSLHLAKDSNSQMLARTKAEALNSFRVDSLYRQGRLEDYNFVVFSRAADDMSQEDMRKAGFFIETMSCSIQVTTVEEGRLTTESAFVAGIKEGAWARHDAAAVAEAARQLGVNMEGQSSTETIETPLLIHKSLMPNGAIDLVKMYDEAVGDTFFGESKPRENYLRYRQKCDDRTAMLKPKVAAIVDELISEAPQIQTKQQATERLHKISEKHMVQQAVMDFSIDARVFGSTAAAHIEAARIHFEQGNIEDALRATRQAERAAVSSSCPTALRAGTNGEAGVDGGQAEGGSKEESGDCDFVSKKCPKCGAKNVKTVISKDWIKGACGCRAKLK